MVTANVLNNSVIECDVHGAFQMFGDVVEAHTFLSIYRKLDEFQSNSIAFTFTSSHYHFRSTDFMKLWLHE
jgi:hypothetical protein